MEVEDIMGLSTQKLYWQFTKVFPPSILRIHLQRLSDWCDSSKLEDVAQRIENAVKNSPDTVHPTNDCTVRNLHRYCEVLCRYIRGNAALDDVMTVYQYKENAAVPQSEKVAKFLRLCDEAVKRNVQYHYDIEANADRWNAAYCYKYVQVEDAMLDIRGGDVYYDIVLLSTHSTHPIIMAAIDAAKEELIKANSHE